MICKACWGMDRNEDFRLDASIAKYLTVMVARDVATWAASLGEGTQDVQKLIIFRKMMKRDADAD